MRFNQQWIKKVSFIYFGFVLFLHVVPLGDDLDLTVNNSYILDGLRLDHLLHGLIFLPTYFFFRSWLHELQTQRSLIAVLLGILFGVFAESLQIFIPYRAFTLPDLMSNAIGALLGLLFFETLRYLHVVKP